MCAQWRRTGSARGPSGAPATCPRFPSLGHRVPILQVESQSFPVWQRSCPWRPLDVFKPSQVHARISKVVWSVGSWPRPCVWELYKYGWWVPPWSSVLMGMFGIPRHAHTRIHAWEENCYFLLLQERSKVRFRPSPSRLLSSSLFPRYPSGVTAQKLYRSLKGSGSSSNVLRIFWEISCSLSSLGWDPLPWSQGYNTLDHAQSYNPRREAPSFLVLFKFPWSFEKLTCVLSLSERHSPWWIYSSSSKVRSCRSAGWFCCQAR